MHIKQRLVIIGNGMAGARFCEEIVARQGLERFEIVIIGERSPMAITIGFCSPVYSQGLMIPTIFFSNPLSWYQKNDVHLHVGKRVQRID